MAHQQILFDDIFDLRTMNDHGKKFEKINRLHCKGTTYDVDLVLDVNSELFSTKIGDRINISLASTLSLDGTPDDGAYNPNPGVSNNII
jgi:DNA-directed RNA polymerase I, II, and III subunit RPABC3